MMIENRDRCLGQTVCLTTFIGGFTVPRFQVLCDLFLEQV